MQAPSRQSRRRPRQSPRRRQSLPHGELRQAGPPGPPPPPGRRCLAARRPPQSGQFGQHLLGARVAVLGIGCQQPQQQGEALGHGRVDARRRIEQRPRAAKRQKLIERRPQTVEFHPPIDRTARKFFGRQTSGIVDETGGPAFVDADFIIRSNEDTPQPDGTMQTAAGMPGGQAAEGLFEPVDNEDIRRQLAPLPIVRSTISLRQKPSTFSMLSLIGGKAWGTMVAMLRPPPRKWHPAFTLHRNYPADQQGMRSCAFIF